MQNQNQNQKQKQKQEQNQKVLHPMAGAFQRVFVDINPGPAGPRQTSKHRDVVALWHRLRLASGSYGVTEAENVWKR